MDYVALGERIRDARKRQKRTQKLLAEQAGMSASFLGHVERGSRKASIETLVRICNCLDLSVDVALGRIQSSQQADKAKCARELLSKALEFANALEEMR